MLWTPPVKPAYMELQAAYKAAGMMFNLYHLINKQQQVELMW